MIDPSAKLAIYMEGAVLGSAGKMGVGVLRYSRNQFACVIDSETAGQSLGELTGLPVSCPIVASVDEAIALGPSVLILGIAPPGGLIPDSWWPIIEHALESGLSIVNGLHDLIAPRFPNLSSSPGSKGQFVWDIRVEPPGLGPGTNAAAALTNRRVLLVGTDMAIGKMTAGLEIGTGLTRRGVPNGFVATGQIGITITGAGVPLDAIRVDFASGAIEGEVLRHSAEGAEIVIVEGQGSLLHPGSTANLPLLRGTCPTHLVLCHRAGQTTIRNYPDLQIPPLDCVAKLYEQLAEACGTFPRPKTACVALNTAHLSPGEAAEACRQIESTLSLPCADPIRDGVDRLIDALLA